MSLAQVILHITKTHYYLTRETFGLSPKLPQKFHECVWCACIYTHIYTYTYISHRYTNICEQKEY